MGNDQGKMGNSATPAGIQSMDETLQKKFSKGIQFNMKIILKGDRNTGKTCLFNRMGGKPFTDAYIPTSEIQVTSILWSYKVTSDTVKVEVWDIVDRGKLQKKERKGSLKIFNTQPEDEDEDEGEGGEKGKVLDATFLNVYKGCHGVVLIFDMTKIWTWKYIERELPNIPYDIPVMILANFRDLGDHRVITRDEVIMFIELARPDGSSEIMYAESSMKNAFGLMHLHKFLSIPFLQMQQDMLLQQIQVSREQMMAARDELTNASLTEDQNYDMFVTRLQQSVEQKRKIAQQQQQQQEEAMENSDSPTTTPGQHQPHSMDPERASVRSSSSTSSAATHHPTQATPTSSVSEQRRQNSGSDKKSRLSKFLSRNKEKTPQPSKGPIPVSPRGSSTGAGDIGEFVPEGDVNSFLEDGEVDEGKEEHDGDEEEEKSEEESDDDDGSHPMVAGDEDLSSAEEEDSIPSKPVSSEPSPAMAVKRDKPVRTPVQLKSAKDIELTESEEEDQTVPHSKQKDLDLFWGQVGDSVRKGSSSDGSGSKDTVEKSKLKVKAKSGGLLLNWNVPGPTTTTNSSDNKSSKKKKNESPDIREDRKEGRKKRSSSRKKKTEKGTTTTTNGSTTNDTTNDPFTAISSLDAWLNSEDTNILQPTMSPLGRGGELGEEITPDEGGTTSHGVKKPKKHRDRSGTGSDSTRKKKKHKSRHSAKEGEGEGTF